MATVNFINYKKGQSRESTKAVMDYVSQEAKVSHAGRKLVSGFNCMADTAYQDFISTKKLYGKEDGKQFYHFTQSFSPEENITPELAHEVALRLAEFYQGFEVLVATHVDREHIHSHFVVNSVSFDTGKKLHQNGQTIKDIRAVSDALCLEYGLSICQKKENRQKPMPAGEYHSAKRGDSWKLQLMATIDQCMSKAKSKKQFKKLMADKGYRVTWEESRKYITYTTPEGKKCRCNKLHEEKYRKERMELEFRIRGEIVARRAESPEPTAIRSTAGATALDDGAGGLGADFGEPENSVGQAGGASRTNQQQAPMHEDSTGADLHQEASGGTDPTAPENSADTRTGWEKERAEVFTSKNQTARGGASFSGVAPGTGLQLLGDLVQLGKTVESLGEEPYRPAVQDATGMDLHIDRKRRKEMREKGMTQTM